MTPLLAWPQRLPSMRSVLIVRVGGSLCIALGSCFFRVCYIQCWPWGGLHRTVAKDVLLVVRIVRPEHRAAFCASASCHCVIVEKAHPNTHKPKSCCKLSLSAFCLRIPQFCLLASIGQRIGFFSFECEDLSLTLPAALLSGVHA